MIAQDSISTLPRVADAPIERDFGDWVHLFAFGAIGWPWLAKSLYGGRKADKAALLKRLCLPCDALPNLGSWKADTGLLNLIVDVIGEQQPQTVVELGSGASTLVAARALALAGHGGRLVSYDHHADFVASTMSWLKDHGVEADVRAAPLASASGRWDDLWYNLTSVPESIDLLLIDGPPWAVNPFIRGKADCLFDRMAPGGIVILDDAARPGERLVARRWREDWPAAQWDYLGGIKGTLMGRWP